MGASNYKKTASNQLEIARIFYYKVLCSKEFRDIYLSSGGSDYEELISSPASLRTFRDRIMVRAFNSHDESLWKLVETTNAIINLFIDNSNTLFLPSEDGKFKLCEACFRFFNTADWRKRYCSIHRNNRNERESNLRKIKHLESKTYQMPEMNHQDIFEMESSMLDLVSMYGMHDNSISRLDDATDLARHLKEEALTNGNYLYMLAIDRLLALEGKSMLKPGPKRNYDVNKIIKLRSQGLKWKELEELTGKSRQALSNALSQSKNK